MANLDLAALGLNSGVLVELSWNDGRVVLWTPLASDAGFQYWDRVSTAHRGKVHAQDGIHWTAATATLARRRSSGGAFVRLLGKLTGRDADAGWVMPDGATVERCGERRSDLALVWTAADETLAEERLRGLWPGDVQFRRLGERLALASGIDPGAAAAAERTHVNEAEEPAATAVRLLESARTAGDRRAEATALADLAMLWAKDEPQKAVTPLFEALALRRALGDRGGEAEVQVDLGRVLKALGRADESRSALEAASALAEGLTDAFARLAVLERLGDVLLKQGDPATATAVLARARKSVQAIGDRRHEARLLWLQAAAWAESGRPDLALTTAEESTSLLRASGAAEADWYAAQLQRYRSEALGSAPATRPIDAGVAMGLAEPSTHVAGDPGIFRMALSASRAMATFLGTGMKTTTVEEQRVRIATCQSCVHHTGLRCRICGCFTSPKTALPHERCPIGRW
ncbi:tetratricopeptide repeat protein [Paludisphaera rhizosphaerae]|uniref:tetratricopeptide repeat protein n=1 Tax=Paludisphaera rhizosphaerae TaxID=2711216 RepID=UPI0013EC48E7|nr:tetratricopeptide repeat protein [Paludisphaera rhizosphaerae]